MAFIKWDDSFSVKINSIDEQHKKLVSLINDYYDAIQKKYSVDELKKLVKGLEDYTVYHFTYEEDLMQKHGYTGYDNQKKAHTGFIDKIEDTNTRLTKGNVLPVEVTNFLKTWITEHIKKMDMEYSEYFINCGVV